LGIYGPPAGPWAPYGTGGGGSFERIGLRDRRIVLASSMAKAFGAPVAVLAGTSALVGEYERHSATRVHCSPPSAAVIAAAAQALEINRRYGDRLRLQLAQRVRALRSALWKLGVLGTDGIFPVQALSLPEHVEARLLYQLLLDRGIETLLDRKAGSGAAGLGFVISARHTAEEIGRAVNCLADALARGPWGNRKGASNNGWTFEHTGETIRGVFPVR
jgi:8-amino-7-oxononanoate synthase